MYRFIRNKQEGGFTLLELLIVVVIIGILVAVAMPQYLKTREKARMSEAISTLGQLRASEMRYYAENDKYTGTLTELDFSPTDVAGTPIFTYSIPTPGSGSTSVTNFIVSATRSTAPAVGPGCTSAYHVKLTHSGTLCGRDCQSTADNCTP